MIRRVSIYKKMEYNPNMDSRQLKSDWENHRKIVGFKQAE